MLYVIASKRGGIVGINCYTSKDAAKLVFSHWQLSSEQYEIIELYPVDLDCVKTWKANTEKL